MTVGELRKALENVPDDIPVVMGYDGGTQYSGDAKDARVIDYKSKGMMIDWRINPDISNVFFIPD